MPKGTQEFMQALTQPADTTIGIPALQSSQDLKDACQMVYQHFLERHQIDRIVQALYLQPDGVTRLSRKQFVTLEEAARITFMGRDHASCDLTIKYAIPSLIINRYIAHCHLNAYKKITETTIASKRRVVFPRPAEMPAVIKKTRESSYDLLLLYLLLTEPLLRFRICLLAHLLEAGFGIMNGQAFGEHPRPLLGDERNFVLEKLRDVFIDLFEQPIAQASLRRFLTVVYEWTMDGMRMKPEELEETEPDLPEIIKEFFPGHAAIVQEYRNLLQTGRNDPAVKSGTYLLFKFVMLSLKQYNFASASDWVDEGHEVLENLQKTLYNTNYRGPTQRLIRNIVCTTYQLWEGGRTTDMSFVIEKCLATVIKKLLRASGTEGDQDAGSGVGGWDVMEDFEQFVQAISNDATPIPLPSIVWTRGDSKICLGAMEVHLPNLVPGGIQLQTSTGFDRSNRPCRQWDLKVKGVEAVVNNVPYFYVAESRLRGRFVDVGEISLRVPPNSLDLDIRFTVTVPEIRRGATTALRRAQEQPGKTHPIVTAAYAALSPQASSAPDAIITDLAHTRRQSSGGSPFRVSAAQDQTTGRRHSEPAYRAMEMGRSLARTGAQVGEHVRDVVREDASTAFRVIRSVLYPNQPRHRSLRSLEEPYESLHRVEQMFSNRVASGDRITWGRARRRGISFESRTAAVRDYYRDPIETSSTPGHPLEEDQDRSRTTIPGLSDDTRSTGHDRELNRKRFLDVKECKVRVRKLDIQVLSTKHPVMHTLMHALLVQRVRKGLEQAICHALADVVDTINAGVDNMMAFSREELASRHKDRNLRMSPSGGVRATVQQQQQQARG
ncbi:hypothetical protein BGZ54_009354 [Gamsiella multidivaricata]|nr:hypothetical protein BGZ54_009354 [Gamsiella multidivaricata]